MRLKGIQAVFALLSFATAAEAASVNDWRGDIDQIVNDIRRLHPDPFTKTGRRAFARETEALKAALPELSEEERLVGAMRLVALIGDGHTQLEPNEARFDAWYPVRFYEFTDGYFIVGAHRSVAELAGAKVIEIGGRPAAEAAEAARDLMGADNRFDRMERLFGLSGAAVMKGLGFAEADGGLKLKLRLRNGRTVTRTLPATKSSPDTPTAGASFEWRFFPKVKGPPVGTYDDWIGVFGNSYTDYRQKDFSRPLHLAYARAYVAKALPEKSAYYVQVNIVTDASYEKETLAGLFRKAFEEMRAYKPKRFIVDWRYNFGGDGSLVPSMIHEFIKQEDDPPYGELYILTGRRTFSAAIMAMEGFTKHTRYSIVGEPSGAALNHYGDAEPIQYAKTGLQLYVSTLWHQLNEYDPGAWVYVDVPAPFSFADYAAGRDPAIDTILAGEDMRALPVIALADGGARARSVLKERQKKFAKYDWWAPPRFRDVKTVGNDLLEDLGRPEDAAEIFTLLTELYPNEWNSWERRGRAQTAAGDKAGAAMSYRCALALDPDTYEDGDLNAAIAEVEAETGRAVPYPDDCPAGNAG
jgi:tetratricopeptide (TPR) repeat protein